LTRAAKAYAKTAGTEIATETAQEALETKFRRDIGITDMSSLDAAVSVIGPTLVTSALFLGSAKGVNSLDRKRIKKGLEQAVNPDGTPASPKKRKKAVDSAVDVIAKSGVGKEGKKAAKAKAEAIRQSSYAYIDAGTSIDLETDFGVLEYVGLMAKDLNSGALNVHDMEKAGQGLQGDNQSLSDEILKVATSYKIQNGIPDLGEVTQPGGEEDLVDVMLNPAKDVTLEETEGEEITDSETVDDPAAGEKEVDDALAGKTPGLNEDIPVLSDAELEAELVSLKETFPAQEPVLGEIQQERIDAINNELGEREGEAAVQEERKRVLAEIEAPKEPVPLEPRVAEFKETEPVKERQKAQREGIEEPGVKLKPEEKKKVLEELKAQQEAPVITGEETPEAAKKAVDVAAEQTDEAPTEAQIEAGNAKKGHVKVQGLDISIETAEGQERSGTDLSGKPWTVTMKSHYGYIKGTKGRDKEHLDAFIGKDPTSENVFVVNQINPESGAFDEHKVMLGFDSIEAAETGYRGNYAKGWNGLKSIVPMSMVEFKEWIKGDTTKELVAPKMPKREVSEEGEVIAPVPPIPKEPTAVQEEAEKEIPTAVQKPKKAPKAKKKADAEKQLKETSIDDITALITDLQPESIHEVVHRGNTVVRSFYVSGMFFHKDLSQTYAPGSIAPA
jgi:hypothetical protein